MKILKRIFIDGLSGMAIGLFATLIIGTILEQIGTFVGGDIGHMIVMAASIAKVLTGAGIGIGVACKLGEETLVCASAASAGMIGAFATASFRENGIGGLLAQGIGTSMLQVPNIVRKPLIWLPTIITSAILGPISTVVLKMTNNAIGSGMGTAGLVGPIMAYKTMITNTSPTITILMILVMLIIAPAFLTYFISEAMRRKGLIKDGDMKLEI